MKKNKVWILISIVILVAVIIILPNNHIHGCLLGYEKAEDNECLHAQDIQGSITDIEYAKKWYNKRNNQYYGYVQDCASFVSQCLYARGLPMNENWYSYRMDSCYYYFWEVGAPWRLAADQYNYFSNPENGFINGEVIEINNVSELAEEAKNGGIQAGDLLYFDENRDGVPNHAAMISKVDSGMLYYTAHTFARFNQPLSAYFCTRNNEARVYIIKLKNSF